jgi:hypothetical protein
MPGVPVRPRRTFLCQFGSCGPTTDIRVANNFLGSNVQRFAAEPAVPMTKDNAVMEEARRVHERGGESERLEVIW